MQQLECDTCTSKARKWVLTVFAFGIYDCDDFLWDLIWYSVMVCDDDIDSETFGVMDRLDISSSTVHSDDESDSFVSELIEKICLQPISIMYPMREPV